MHVVQCPHCHKKFKVPEPVSNARMKCGKCGQTFVASSAEATDKPDEPDQTAFVPPVRPMHLSKETSRRPRTKTSSTSIILLIAGIFGILGVSAMAIIGYHRLTHPTVIVRDARTGRIVEREKTTLAEAERRIARHRAEDGKSAPPEQSPDSSVQTIKSDPKLQPGWEIVKTDGGGNMHVCGSVLNTHDVARKQIIVTVYINGARGLSRIYQFVPPGGVIRFSIRLGGRKADENNIKVVAVGNPVDADTIVWAIDAGQMNFKEVEDKVVWTGMTRNRSSSPVKDVKIYCDFFDDEGLQGNDKPVIGGLVSARTIGAGKSADFRVEFGVFAAADIYKTIVARAVGRKY